MLGVVFQDLSMRDCFKQIVERNILFDHLLLRVLCNAQISRVKLNLNPMQNAFPSIVVHACPVKWVGQAGGRSA